MTASAADCVVYFDGAHSAFLRLRPLWRRAVKPSNALPAAVLADLRTDHAGEVGAVHIHRGILAVARLAGSARVTRRLPHGPLNQ